jgi:glycosyltransferase involved in cell wall biosynthesis
MTVINKNSLPAISVAIATFNRAALVERAIESALTQSRPPVEVIISDDASSDDTLHVVARMASVDRRVKLLRQENNSGGVGNWNRVLEATHGDLIAWCSDDDCYRPGHLDASAAYLAAHPEVALVHSGFVDWMEGEGSRTVGYRPLRARQPLVIDRGNLFRYLVRYYNWPFHPSTIVMRRRVWDEMGPFDPSYALADTDWFVRVALRFPVAMLARYGVNNRRHPGNWSNRLGSARMQQEILEIVEKALDATYGARRARRLWWKKVWRATVRVHLLLTVRARLRTGHAEAACAAWRAMFFRAALPNSLQPEHAASAARAPRWYVRAGETWLRRRASRVAEIVGGAGPSVSPL